jgi:hypothetical protein
MVGVRTPPPRATRAFERLVEEDADHAARRISATEKLIAQPVDDERL